MRTETILKYANERVPRYTSYPTAPHFSPDLDARDYGQWLAGLDPNAPVSLYLHVPFCRTMCWYCGCHTKATRRIAPVDAYADILLKEIDTVANHTAARLKVSHIHWGGGSPTYLPPRRFEALMDRIRHRFDVLPDAEIAVEVDPRIFDDAMASAFVASGVTRASLGVQTFDDSVQRAVNRIQPRELVEECVDMLRDAGVTGLNFDLLYGLPLQTVENCIASARMALALRPDRFSVFGYAHVPHMKPHQSMIAENDLPGAAQRLAQADAIAGTLAAGGQVPIGLDHFARAGDELARALEAGALRRNFQGYTTDTAPAIIGLGASAIGWLPRGYVQNTAHTHDWERRVLNGELPTARGYRLTPEDRLRRSIIEQLMCTLSADPAALAAAAGLAVPQADLSAFQAAGIVAREGSRVIVDPAYRPLVRNVAAAYDERLQTSSARHAVAV
ncbi:oxygen-independent coproporphyrinogen III oxidase [Maricaulis sp.]|uniref:oxygen-independent coproporphyrinogen III oxidase n=1 Tax=Maricaulis sp. TaxID=1486257 RepID=UPI002610EF85|nr:oxygen-independent coproporphyrinogen III oxidase [Maricaulis sp.]